MTLSTQCLMCKHYTGFSTCDAFPEKIPQEIFDGTFEHTEEYPGDNGIRFEDVESKVDKMIEFDITSLQKAKQRVHVKQTATRKSHYRTQEVGRKEESVKKKSPREGTGRIAGLPDKMRNEILELRRLGDSGAKIKSTIENMIDASDDPNIKYDLAGKGIIKDAAGGASLNMASQSLVDWAKSRGIGSKTQRKTVKAVESAAKESSETAFKESTENLARLQVENKRLKEELETLQRSKMSADALKSKLNTENYLLREKLKALGKPGNDNKKLVSQYVAGMKHASRHLK